MPRSSEPLSRARTVVVGAVGGLLALVLALAFLVVDDRGLDGFIRASPEFADPATAPIDVVDPGEGFDGQFYFRSAVAPLSDASRVEGVAFDLPALRAARVGYPALAGALALGQVGAIPATLVIVNVLAAGVVAGAAAALARLGGRSGWWGLVVLAFPGFVYTLGLDLAELVEAAAVLLALLAIRADRAALAMLAMTVAVVTRETALALPLGIVAIAMLARLWPRARERTALWPGRTAVIAAVGALVAGVVWQVVIWARWDEIAVIGSADKNIRIPFAGLIAAREAFAPSSGEALFRIASLAMVVVVAGAALITAWPSARATFATATTDTPPTTNAPHEVAALLVALVVGTVMSEFVWAGATSFMRGLTEVWVLSLVIVVTRPARHPLLPPLVVVAAVGGTAATALAELGKRR